ncbi:glutamine-synthetase adenylyltransferase [Roseovarius spongiae]|uniref:Glutamine-synthetase adenylyltransferase n=1 Tax=Roseovarius spongiae TaxID=2320272 RepID=A0A3A8B9Y4_9RHOB|nr:glutamine-synthetase adenylyltransferase [Roseovarius spongiae]RKF15173.1 glutamine-synthetase adenylyltransferase [Roseovarius spongiae]
MNTPARITRLPRPFDPDRGAEARAIMSDLSGEWADLIEGAAGCSPYLHDLIQKEAEWLPGALRDLEAARDAVVAEAGAQAERVGPALRRAKRRIALLVALADLGGVWPLETVTGALTDLADAACAAALRDAVGAEIRRGKLPGMAEDDIASAGGMVVLAMGKMGARELNYSSDIDLICLFDETRYDRDDFAAARASLVRATRRMAALLSENTAEGYVFRTDLRLRPDPSVTPVCMAMAAAETYYESLGRTWERAAYVKARPCAGDLAAGARFLETLTPFVWRRHLDFAAIEDAHNMRLRIRRHKGLGGPIQLDGHNMKLGRGGIREIEFFTQTRQIIAGGRDPDLRVRGTLEGLARLADKGWAPQEAAKALDAHYRFHREVEHRLQMLRDTQTHDLPDSGAEWDRLAAFMGYETQALRDELDERLHAVHDMIEGFFDPGEGGRAPREPDDLGELSPEIIARWPSYPALRSDRAVAIFRRLRPDILARLAATSHPGEALVAFDGFLAGLPAGVQVFSLFEANPQLIDLLVDIVGTAPGLASYLSRNAQVLDAVIAGDFFAAWPGQETLTAQLTEALAAEGDYEARLDATRRWRREWHFRIGVHHLRGLITGAEAGAQYADLADAVLAALWPEVVAQFARKHGAPPGRGAALLGMGSLGARRLTAESDLDLIVIYDADGVEASDGSRPLPARSYYARLTQAMITALSAPMAQGRLYEVDMRLRPSGNQGPVATAWAAFQDYQSEKAWLWEHLALTRARVVAGAPDLGNDVEAFRVALLSRPRNRREVLGAVREMRARIHAAKAPGGPLDPKLGPGRLQEVQLIAQAATLLAGGAERGTRAGIAAGVAIGWLDDADGAALGHAYALCSGLQQAARLLGTDPPDPDMLGQGAARFVLRETGQEDVGALVTALGRAGRRAGEAIDRALSDPPEE